MAAAEWAEGNNMAGGSNPQNVAQPSVFNQAAGAYNAALQGPNIGQFMNPFTQNVTNRAMADIGTAQQMAQNQLGAQATQARAFGGSRHGVADRGDSRARQWRVAGR